MVVLSFSDASDPDASSPARPDFDEAAALDSDVLTARVLDSLSTASGGLRADEVASAIGITVLESWSLLTTLERSGRVRHLGSLWIRTRRADPR